MSEIQALYDEIVPADNKLILMSEQDAMDSLETTVPDTVLTDEETDTDDSVDFDDDIEDEDDEDESDFDDDDDETEEDEIDDDFPEALLDHFERN